MKMNINATQVNHDKRREQKRKRRENTDKKEVLAGGRGLGESDCLSSHPTPTPIIHLA